VRDKQEADERWTTSARKDGGSFPVGVSSRGATIGGQRLILSIIRDITERKRAEQRQRFLAEAGFGATTRRASRSQIAVLGPGRALTVVDAQPGTRFMLMAGKPYGEVPVFNGPFVD